MMQPNILVKTGIEQMHCWCCFSWKSRYPETLQTRSDADAGRVHVLRALEWSMILDVERLARWSSRCISSNRANDSNFNERSSRNRIEIVRWSERRSFALFFSFFLFLFSSFLARRHCTYDCSLMTGIKQRKSYDVRCTNCPRFFFASNRFNPLTYELNKIRYDQKMGCIFHFNTLKCCWITNITAWYIYLYKSWTLCWMGLLLLKKLELLEKLQ